MLFRVLFSFLLLMICASCNDVSSSKITSEQELDTIVDFKKVDASPYFKVCENLIDEAKTNCFRVNIQQYFTRNFRTLNLTSETNFDEEIIVTLSIHKNGTASLKKLESPEVIKLNYPNITDLIGDMVTKMPKLYPALKRGIPVKAEYKLPIRIKTSYTINL